MSLIQKGVRILKEDGITSFLFAFLSYSEMKLSRSFLILSYIYTMIWGRKENLWIFTDTLSNRKFVQNSKYLYLFLSNDKECDVEPIWLTNSETLSKELREHGYTALNRNSLEGRIHTLQAEYIFTDAGMGAHNWQYSGGVTKIQMGHGIPLKSDKKYVTSTSQPSSLHHVDYFLYSSEKCEAHHRQYDSNSENPLPFVQAMRSGTGIYTGYPRTDVFLREIEGKNIGSSTELLEQVHSFTNSSNVVGYFPTFRENKVKLSGILDKNMLQDFLARNDLKLLIKPHELLDIDFDTSNMDNILVVGSGLDSHLFLDRIDILITDYSSIYFDYLLLDRPVVFYTPDYSTYQDIRGVHPNYENVIAGPRVDDFEGLLDQLESIVNGVDEYGDRRQEIRDRFFEHADGNACKRIVERLTDHN